MKICTKCKQTKALSEYGKHSKQHDGLRAVCKLCRKLEAQLSYKTKDKQLHLLNAIKNRAKAQNIPFNLEYDDLTPPKFCPVFNVEIGRIEPHSKASKRFSISVDRIIPEKGYVKDNIQIISQLANVMKHDATINELKMFARWIFNTYGE